MGLYVSCHILRPEVQVIIYNSIKEYNIIRYPPPVRWMSTKYVVTDPIFIRRKKKKKTSMKWTTLLVIYKDHNGIKRWTSIDWSRKEQKEEDYLKNLYHNY